LIGKVVVGLGLGILGCSSRAPLREPPGAVDAATPKADTAKAPAPKDAAPPDRAGHGMLHTPRLIGEPCVENIDCTTASCANGVCCNRACDDWCARCDLPDLVGQCTPSAAVGTSCYPGECSADGISVVFTMVCDGLGTCRPGPNEVCAPFSCDPTVRACRTLCRTSDDCVTGIACTNGSCQNPHGAALCDRDEECASDHCAQGICCGTACDAPGMSCNLAGTRGTCTPIPDASTDG
jgi:hypothetical protein